MDQEVADALAALENKISTLEVQNQELIKSINASVEVINSWVEKLDQEAIKTNRSLKFLLAMLIINIVGVLI